MYQQLFERNYGVFTAEEQDRVKNARVVLIGCGGIGSVIGSALARSGLEHYVLYEFDTFSITNMNRQMTCFEDTLGVNKALVLRDTILKINPEADIEIYERALLPDEIPQMLAKGDVIVPSADEWPLSITILGAAKEYGVPAIMSYPSGALGRVSTFMPSSPYAAECLVMPYKATYEELQTFMNDPVNRHLCQYYRTDGDWTDEWFEKWCESELPHPQICSIVWLTGTLAAMEVIKIVSGKWKPVTAPRYWHVTPEGAHIARFSRGRMMLSHFLAKPKGAAFLNSLTKQQWLMNLFTDVLK